MYSGRVYALSGLRPSYVHASYVDLLFGAIRPLISTLQSASVTNIRACYGSAPIVYAVFREGVGNAI